MPTTSDIRNRGIRKIKTLMVSEKLLTTADGEIDIGGGASELSNLNDVNLTGVGASNLLVYDGSNWKPTTINLVDNNNGIYIGPDGYTSNAGQYSVTIGSGYYNKVGGEPFAVAIGADAGYQNQGARCVAVGNGAGGLNQKYGAVAIGWGGGGVEQGSNSIAIGNGAGSNNQATNSIVINATGSVLENTTASSLKIAPIRGSNLSIGTGNLFYDTTSKEVVYSTTDAPAPTLDALTGTDLTGKEEDLLLKYDGSNWVPSSYYFKDDNDGISITNNPSIGANPYGSVNLGPTDTSRVSQGPYCVAIGSFCGTSYQGWDYTFNREGANGIAIGFESGNTSQGVNGIAIGTSAGNSCQKDYSIAIGEGAGFNVQGFYSIAIGSAGGAIFQEDECVAIGRNAGSYSQKNNSIAIGKDAGYKNLGSNSIAIGKGAGSNNQASNSIVINASGSALENTTADSLKIAPIRNEPTLTGFCNLYYNPITKEICYN